METTFPFSALERQEDLSSSVQITIPFRIFLILEMRPHIVMKLHEPFQAFLVSCKLVSLDHAYRRLKMYPPELLIPFELLIIKLAVEAHAAFYHAVDRLVVVNADLLKRRLQPGNDFVGVDLSGVEKLENGFDDRRLLHRALPFPFPER